MVEVASIRLNGDYVTQLGGFGDIVECQALTQEAGQKEGRKEGSRPQNATESELDVLIRTVDQRDSFWNKHRVRCRQIIHIHIHRLKGSTYLPEM
jgi:hypothetical protein